MGPLGLPIFHLGTKFGAKMLIDAEIKAKIEIKDGGRPTSWIFENPTSEHWDPLSCRFSITVTNLAQKNVELRRNYGPKSKSKMAAVRHLGFSKI